METALRPLLLSMDWQQFSVIGPVWELCGAVQRLYNMWGCHLALTDVARRTEVKFKLVSITALSVLVLLAAAMACSNDGDDNLETPATGLKESTPQATESKAPTDGQASSMVFPRHDAPLGTDRGGEYFAGRLVVSQGCLRADAPTRIATNPRSSWLLIWPGAFTLEAESGSVRIVDGLGRIAAQVGDHVRLSRAAVTYQQAIDQGLVEGLSEDCGEPYLLVGDEVTVFDPKNEATELRLSDPDVLLLSPNPPREGVWLAS